MKNSYGVSFCAAFLSLISLQVGAAFAKTIFPLAGPEGVSLLRVSIASILFLLLFRPWRLKVGGDGWGVLVMYGAMVALMNILIYRAFLYIPVGISIAIEVLGPLGVSLISTRRFSDVIWILFALFGVMLLPYGQPGFMLNITGVIYAFLAGLCWGVYIIYASKAACLGSKGVSIGMVFAAIFVFPLGVSQVGLELFDFEFLVLGLVVAILSSIIPFLLDIYALKKLPRSIFGILMSASPVVSALAGWLVLGETLSLVQWLGIGLVCLACIGVSLPSHIFIKLKWNNLIKI